MKKIIRQGTFETNSSSSHSLVVKKQDEYFTDDEILNSVLINKEGQIQMSEYSLSFERSPNIPLFNFGRKLAYLIASYRNEKDVIVKIENLVKAIVPGCTGIKFPISSDWTSESTQIFYGYIDHQSDGLLRGYLTKNEISFKEFLTNKKYVVIIDGDEYGMWEWFKKVD